MANLLITEFSDTRDRPGVVGVVNGDAIVANQVIVIGAASVASAAFSGNTKVVRIKAEAACSVTFGNTPVATNANMKLDSGQVEYFGVPSGGKLAVIQNP